MAASPTAPPPPCTSNVRPATGPSAKTAKCAVIAGTPKQAPTAKSTPSGSGARLPSGTVRNSAAVPYSRSSRTKVVPGMLQIHTRWPSRRLPSSSPASTTSPAPSQWGTMRRPGQAAFRQPARRFTSDGLTPEAAIRTSTSPWRGFGLGISPNVKTSGGPKRS
jgi:hypothetical protein